MSREINQGSSIFVPEESDLYQASLADQGDEVNGLNENERMLSVMNIDLNASDLPLDRQLTLLRSMRKFAEVVAGRHYIYGWGDGKKLAATWTDVKKKLPEKGQRVLVWMTWAGGVAALGWVEKYDTDQSPLWELSVSSSDLTKDVSHWMPLPDGPGKK